MELEDSPPTRRSGAGKSLTDPQGWTLALTVMAYSMCALDGLIVITALPDIGHDLNTSASTLQWTVNAYAITWAAGMITAAAIADLKGRRRLFSIGLAVFTASSALCAVAPNMAVLIAGRAVQGVGASIILPLSLTILVGVFPAERRGSIIGIWGGIGGLAVALGPLIGGAMTQNLNWHWVFWINVPIGLVLLALVPRRIAESHGPGRRLDLPGVLLVTVGAVVTIWSMVRGDDLGWSDPQVIGGLAVGSALIAGFVAWERVAPEPMVPLRLFRNMSFSAANTTAFLMSGALYAGSIYVSVYFQSGRATAPFASGVRFLPMMAMPFFIAPIAGSLSDKIGQRRLIVTGLLTEGAGLAWLALAATRTVPYWELVAPMLLTGVGLSMALMTTPTAALNSVPPADMGRGSGINGSLQRFGSAFGAAIATAAFAARGRLDDPSAAVSGAKAGLLVGAGFALLGALVALGIRRRAPHAPPQPTPAPPVASVLTDPKGGNEVGGARE
ncbi:DHA2 family efflux MFS transporter permease subunit [Actinomadura napierensis]|uniref:DHA2 family efflux MFS transporter permease subunit n=1 Tax=Actinomadura napierensis TaxID=267854 RepID=A0ABP5LS42_9ACTN